VNIRIMHCSAATSEITIIQTVILVFVFFKQHKNVSCTSVQHYRLPLIIILPVSPDPSGLPTKS